MMIQCKAIEKRRSVRVFDRKRLLEESEVYGCLEAAIKAPSSHNNQPWRFRIIMNRELIIHLSTLLPQNGWIKMAPVIVVVGVVKATGVGAYKNYLAVGSAIENMLLEAQQRGIGTCWIGECLEKRLEDALLWPKDLEIVAIIAMGYERKYKEIGTTRMSIEQLMV